MTDGATWIGRLLNRHEVCVFRLGTKVSEPDEDAAGSEDAAGTKTFGNNFSLGPKLTALPLAITSTKSTPAKVLGRCATTTIMPPRLRTREIACISADSPSASRLEFGSSSTTRKGLR